MTVWYRASQINQVRQVFSGDGGLFTAARWNHLGRRIVYCSQSIALCTLEWLSHNGLSVSGFHYYRYSIDVPEALVKRVTAAHLPKTWNAVPATELTRDFAEEHLFLSEKYLALALPSVLVPEECNLIINPMHDQFPEVIKTVKNLGKHSAPLR